MNAPAFPAQVRDVAPPTVTTGTCFCGAVAIETTGAPEEMGLCHCNSCRAYSGALFVAYTLWRSDKVRVIRGESLLGAFNKTGMSNRRFCTLCGGHVMAEHPGLDVTDVCAGILPDLPFVPQVHLNYACAVLEIRDGLPKLRDFPAAVGGSGEFLDEAPAALG